MTVDLSPLYRTAIGFDRLAGMLENANRLESAGYPPYNIEVTGEDEYQITMAVAGFTDDELSIESKQNELTVSGEKAGSEDDRQFLHRGIATRSFERKFQLADHVFVKGARLEHGLLHIDLYRELPEALKPRSVSIETGKLIESQS
ncbi:MAG: Hsp20 family protein [Pseudomonadota bacterium]|nr:Hsp20 family protein [Pseudomonadota bacterium]MEC9076947.1 Hsp20 family protein [Pseudomonadota bacterium]